MNSQGNDTFDRVIFVKEIYILDLYRPIIHISKFIYNYSKNVIGNE